MGKTLWLRATDAHVVRSTRTTGTSSPIPAAARAGERITVRDHLPPNAARFLAHDRTWCLEQAERVGPACASSIAQLLADRILEKLRAAQGVLRLAERYGAARLEARLRPRARPRLAPLPHRQDHPRRRSTTCAPIRNDGIDPTTPATAAVRASCVTLPTSLPRSPVGCTDP